MALVRIGWAAIALAASLGAAQGSGAPKRLVALSDCPSEGRANGCLEMIMHWDYARTDRAPLAATGAAGGKTVRVLKVRARLNNGGARFFELSVGSTRAGGADDLGEVAYLGRSREGRPIVLTDKGPLALETRGLHVGRADGLVIIDEKSETIAGSYLGGLDGGTYFVTSPNAIAAKARNGACLAPPESRPGELKGAPACGGQHAVAEGLAFSERISGAVAPATGANLALIRKLLPQTADISDADLRARVGRIGDHHLVVTPWKREE